MPTLNEWTDKWAALLPKIEARIEAIEAEALAAAAQVAEVDPLDPTPAASLDSALQARFNTLGDRLDEAFETIDAGIDALLDGTERPGTIATLAAARDRMDDERTALAVRIDRGEHVAKTRVAALLARAIERQVPGEDPTQTCVQCGSPFDPGAVYQSTALSCPGCGARVTVGPRPAALAWYSRGVDAVAEERALHDWHAYRDAEDAYTALRHPTVADLDTLQAAYRAYQENLAATRVAQHPAWDDAKAAELVEGRCKQLCSLHLRFGEAKMRRTGAGLQAARTRDAGRLRRWLAEETSTGTGHTLLVDDLLEAAAERADRAAAETLIEVAHAAEMPRWFGRQRWLRGKLRELSPALA